MEKIVISASYFGINAGDEAILDAIIESVYSVRKDIKVVVLAWDRKNVLKAHQEIFKKHGIILSQEVGGIYQLKEPSKFFPILGSFWHFFSCKYVIFGGGGLINEEGFFLKRYLLTLKIAEFFRKRTFVFAIGVNKLKDKNNCRQVADILNKVDIISVRDEESKNNLIEAGVLKEIAVVADPAFLLKTDNKIRDSYNPVKIGVNLRPWFDRNVHKAEEKEKMDLALGNIANMLISLAKKYDPEFHFFPFDKKKDSGIYQKLASLCGEKIRMSSHGGLITPGEYLREMANMDIFIGMRLHSLIFSILCKLPFFAISYTEKTENLMKSLDLAENCMNINALSDKDFDFDIIADKISVLMQNNNRVAAREKKEIAVKRAEKNIELLKEFLYG